MKKEICGLHGVRRKEKKLVNKSCAEFIKHFLDSVYELCRYFYLDRGCFIVG